MAHKSKALVLDSWSVLAYLGDESAGLKVAELIADSHENGKQILLSIINAGEIWYITARQSSEKEANDALNILKELGVEFVDIDWDLTREAAYFKTITKMSFADCFAAALAKKRKGDLVTGESGFKKIEDEIKIFWIQIE
jgi:predicted nucleic acid-binding protein